MNLESRLKRLEQQMDLAGCPVCGQPRPDKAEAQSFYTEQLASLRANGYSGEEAQQIFVKALPDYALRLNLITAAPAEPGLCRGCGQDVLKLAERAQYELTRLTAEFGAERARQILAEGDPELAALVCG